ncbi:class I SAM-dependent methyltransferase [Parvibaculum sp. MBR-TMA-1.3b-4.2]|jgi:SAM-dependent methyltransferase
MYKVDFLESARIETQWPCPACGAASASVGVSVDTGMVELGVQELAQCGVCGSWFFLGEDPVLGYQDDVIEPKYWIHYVQVGAGIDAMLRPVMALGERARGTFLDVGCGFGFVPDFWSKSGRGEAIGLELAAYGKVGKRLLGAEIHHEYLAECEAIRGRKFDFVYSSEVIEHVRDPQGFLKELAGVLAPEGMVMLTTPSASCVRKDFEETRLHSALSPGFHYFLLSAERLETLLEAAGFAFHVVEDNGERLTAWASRVPFEKPGPKPFDWEEYLGYLEKVSERGDPHLKGGMLYRLFKDGMNTGHMDVARRAFPRLEEHAKNAYGIDLNFPNISEALQSPDFLDGSEQYPAWLGGALFMAGIYAGNELHDAQRKLRLLEASTHMLEHEMETGFQFAQEAAAFLPAATYNYRMALVELLSTEIPRGLDREVPNVYARPDKKQIKAFERRLLELAGTINTFARSGLAKWLQ